ncbi:aminopeptidase P family protein [Tessaracoccus rhinocerotis]|uniref:Xaa-Pro aminopeptidase n=1 Tax=Tessaracoccus rhinocerotis TaxID=1689449 RepID=A0A553K257_9ACTN|nr:aminopeptidase P family protein [Tessaracoccus rhinocerotis]TRY18790.1 aminopeptidase P family protein [Tessaracoccus rhinocerotis]
MTSDNRKPPYSETFKKFIVQGWSPDTDSDVARLAAADWVAARHEKVAAAFPGATLVLPAGPLKVRSNDTDYRFRPHTAFAWTSGLGEDREPDAALVIGADGVATVYFRPRAPRTDEEFYANARYGEMWVGKRDSLDEMAARTGLAVADVRNLREDLAAAERLLVVRDADPEVTALVDELRGRDEVDGDAELARVVSELRLVKDEFEIEEMRRACDATRIGFEAVARELPNAVANGRGERWVEGIFALHARHLGNAVGYDTIAAGGDHANTLHWIRNDGELVGDELILLDAGVEVNSLYTADVTRTLPVGGRFSAAQRRVYEVVLAAQEAGIQACRPGASFMDPHNAAVKVLAEFFHELGILPGTVDETLAQEGGYHRRWMVHGTSHHLGMDVHDCAQARREVYREGTLAEGMVITVEPGIYFKAGDELVPAEYRGIGVRIEDDILVTADGHENLSAALPRAADDLEAWLAQLQG